jgi:hypothetical protein
MAKKKSNTVKVDFTGIEAGGGGRLLPEGEELFKVEEATVETGEESGKDYIKVTLAVVDGDFEGTKAYDNLSLQPQALWKLRGFMEALGLATEDGEMEIDPEDFVGLEVKANVIHEEYKGKTKHRIDGYAPAEDSTPADNKGGALKKKVAKKDDEFNVGDKVTFKDGKQTLSGKITEINDDKVTVKVGKDEYEMETSDITAA